MNVVSIIQNLGGGGGRVLIDIIKGTPHFRHTVCYAVPIGDYSYGFGKELDDLGVSHLYTPSQEALDKLCGEIQPDLVLYHWWRGAVFRHSDNYKSVPWIMIIHSLMPAPQGYDFYVAVSKTCYQVQAHIPVEKREVIYNGVDLALFENVLNVKDKIDDGFVIGRLSHLLPKKINANYVDLVYTFDIPDLKVLIVGNGPMEDIIRMRAKELEIESRLEFSGKVIHHELPQYLRRFDLSLYLTNIPESFCISIVECLAMGIPVVTHPTGALPEIITHNCNGFMSFFDEDLKRYCELIARHRDLKERLALGARETAKKFDIRIQQNAYQELIQNVLQKFGR